MENFSVKLGYELTSNFWMNRLSFNLSRFKPYRRKAFILQARDVFTNSRKLHSKLHAQVVKIVMAQVIGGKIV